MRQKRVRHSLPFITALVIAVSGNAQAAESNESETHDGHGGALGLTAVDPPRPAPPLELEAARSGERISLADYKGRTVVINFWATWCAPCRREMPSLERAQRQLAEEGVRVLAVSMGDIRKDIEVYADSFDIELTMPLLMDGDRKATEAWGVEHLPTTFVVNGQGRIVYRLVGELEWDSAEALDLLAGIDQPVDAH